MFRKIALLDNLTKCDLTSGRDSPWQSAKDKSHGLVTIEHHLSSLDYDYSGLISNSG